MNHSFAERLKTLYPKIQKCNVKLIRGDVAFAIPTSSKTTSGYIILVRDHHGRNRFTIEVGWSTKGRFPDLPMRPSGNPSVERVEFQKEEYTCRLSNIWSKRDYWWGKDDPADQRSAPLNCEKELKPDQNDSVTVQSRAEKYVTDAVDRFNTHGMPYLDEFFLSKHVVRV